MSARLTEETVNLIESHLKANFATALVAVRADRGDNKVNIVVPRTFHINEKSEGYQAPAVFTIFEDMNFRLVDGQNHINALASGYVSIIVEDQDTDRLMRQAWRYQSALFDMLNKTQLTSTDSKVKLFVKVQRNLYGSNEERPRRVFRKELRFLLEVEHVENF